MSAGSTHRATQENGPSVVAGRLVWTGATTITSADPHSFGGCLRKWWYEHVGGKEQPETDAMRGGTALHAEVQDHLLTGASLTSPLALAGRMYIPQPGSGLLIEKPILFMSKPGVPIYGHVDLYNLRQQYLDEEGVLQQDPPWSFEVKDWKTTSSFQYAKSPHELGENIQLNTYAEAGFRMWGDLERSRLTHAYFLTKGRPASKLVTIMRDRQQVEARWAYAESVIRTMADAAPEQNADRVDANTKACDAYKGCVHREYCTAYQRTSLDSLYGKIATDFTQETAQMGLLSSNPQIMQQPAPQQPDMRTQLAAEEQQMRAQAAQQQAQMPQQINTAQLAEVCQRLGGYGFGFPSLGGNASAAYAQLGGQSVAPGYVYQGIPAPAGSRRSLHTIVLNEVGHIFQLEGELAAERASQQPTQYVPPTQAQAQQFVQQAAPVAQQISAPTGQAPTVMQYNGILPPGAPESMPQLAMQQPIVTNTQVVANQPYVPGSDPSAAPEGTKAGRGRPKKNKDGAPEGVAAGPAQTPPPPNVSAPAPQAPPAAPSPYTETHVYQNSGPAHLQPCVLVNARFAGKDTKSLAGYVDYINGKLAKMYSVTDDGKPGIQDVRCVPKTSPLAFGGWKGAVREVVKAEPPPEDLYHLDTFMDELNEAVADALRVVAAERGWTYVRAVRS